METKGWDVFRNLPPDTDSGSETNQRCLGHVVRVLKVFVYFLSFFIVLGGTVVTKGTLFFMTSQIRPGKTIAYCNKELERDREYHAEISSAEQVRDKQDSNRAFVCNYYITLSSPHRLHGSGPCLWPS